jgi:hypothetical protein
MVCCPKQRGNLLFFLEQIAPFLQKNYQNSLCSPFLFFLLFLINWEEQSAIPDFKKRAERATCSCPLFRKEQKRAEDQTSKLLFFKEKNPSNLLLHSFKKSWKKQFSLWKREKKRVKEWKSRSKSEKPEVRIVKAICNKPTKFKYQIWKLILLKLF